MEPVRHRIDVEPEDAGVTNAEALEQLRHLIVGSALGNLDDLQGRLEDPVRRTADVSEVLPAAITARARQNNELAQALSSTISESLRSSIKKDPQPLADALFPVMGPAIRRAISDALMRMMQSLNQTIEYSISSKSWKWRLEAWRTGKPFAEVMLLHTLVFRVEQIYLIHRDTGLMLVHVQADNAAAADADMVSGMLSAIQDFARDSFRVTKNETLSDFKVGDLTGWIVPGPKAIVAGMIRGMPRLEIKIKMQEACERIHSEFAPQLAKFEGETSVFESSRPILEQCLIEARADSSDEQKSAKRKIPYKLIAGALVVLLLVSLWLYKSARERDAFMEYVRDVKSRPGLVVISTGREDGKYIVAGLRDPLAQDPQRILVEHKLQNAAIAGRWEPYQSLAPEFVQIRAKLALKPPKTAELSVSGNILKGTGTAPAAWIADADRIATALPGIASFDHANLTPLAIPPPATVPAPSLAGVYAILQPPATVQFSITDNKVVATGYASHTWITTARGLSPSLPGGLIFAGDAVVDTDLATLTSRRELLEKNRFVRFADFFAVDPAPGQSDLLDAIADDMKALIDSARTRQVSLQFDVLGHCDSLGVDMTRARISQARAENVAALLVLRGVPSASLTPLGIADREPAAGSGADDTINRRVSFRIEFPAETARRTP